MKLHLDVISNKTMSIHDRQSTPVFTVAVNQTDINTLFHTLKKGGMFMSLLRRTTSHPGCFS